MVHLGFRLAGLLGWPQSSASGLEERGHREFETGEHATTLTETVALNPTAFRTRLECRVAELADLLHATTAELAVLSADLLLLRAERKSALEIKTALITREVSL